MLEGSTIAPLSITIRKTMANKNLLRHKGCGDSSQFHSHDASPVLHWRSRKVDSPPTRSEFREPSPSAPAPLGPNLGEGRQPTFGFGFGFVDNPKRRNGMTHEALEPFGVLVAVLVPLAVRLRRRRAERLANRLWPIRAAREVLREVRLLVLEVALLVSAPGAPRSLL